MIPDPGWTLGSHAGMEAAAEQARRMNLDSILLFAVALFVAAASPGPAVVAIVARVIASGPARTVPFATGAALGDVVWLAVAATGLAALAQAFSGLFTAVRYAGAAYLVLVAGQLWTAPPRVSAASDETIRHEAARSSLGGLALTLGNPKTMVFYLALLPNLLDLTRITPLAFAGLAATTLLVLAIVFGGYIALAARARSLFSTPRAVRRINRGSSIVMAGAAAAIAAR